MNENFLFNSSEMVNLILEEIDFRMGMLSKWEEEYKITENRSAMLNCISRYDELLRLKRIIKSYCQIH
jgi:hypothetical protein